jgi:hypothetical protein
MRSILVDHTRARYAEKRDAAAAAVTPVETAVLAPNRMPDVLEIDQALTRLAE